MNAPKGTEPKQQQQQQGSSNQLNDRYGKIGISAVAGAVQHKREQRPVSAKPFIAPESD